jgi:hypothetical protein
VGTRDNLVAYHEYIKTLKQRVGDELAAGKSLEEITASVTMSEYEHLGMYEGWQPMNVEGMVRYLSAQ